VNYQLVNVDVVRKQVAETDAEAGFGFSSYYAYAVTTTTTVADAAQAQAFSAETTADAVNGLSFS
jgi:hypothetical protein